MRRMLDNDAGCTVISRLRSILRISRTKSVISNSSVGIQIVAMSEKDCLCDFLQIHLISCSTRYLYLFEPVSYRNEGVSAIISPSSSQIWSIFSGTGFP
jgi:hypothetical protein